MLMLSSCSRQLCAGARAALARARSTQASLGLDFGSESVRAVLLDCAGGEEIAQATSDYEHRVITGCLPGDASQVEMPPSYCLQHPLDWVNSAVDAVSRLCTPESVNCVSIGVDFTSCTLLPVRAMPAPTAPGASQSQHVLVPLCLLGPEFAERVHAWPKLWKHHGAARQAEQLTRIALAAGGEQWLRRYGGVIGLEWAFPKALEVFDEDRAAFDSATHFVEAGDWVVHLLLGGQYHERCDDVVRSTCAAGYKACYASGDGFLLSPDVLEAAGTGFSAVLDKLRGRHVAPGRAAGTLASLHGGLPPPPQAPQKPTHEPRTPATAATATAATAAVVQTLRALPKACAALARDQGSAVTVSAACIDAHAGVVGVGVAEPGTVVCVLGTSACYLVNALPEAGEANGAEGANVAEEGIRVVEGVAGAVRDGIVPGLVGYETGQAAVGDSFAWLQRFCGWSFERLEEEAALLPAGAGGIAAIEHLNGCRTPLMDASRRGSLHGLSLSTTPAHVYRALAEASACGCRWIVELLRDGGVACDRFVATGGLAHKALYRQILADVLQSDVAIHPTMQGPARGAAIYGAAAAASDSRDAAALLGFSDVAGAVEEMNRAECGVELVYPKRENAEVYDKLFERYTTLVEVGSGI